MKTNPPAITWHQKITIIEIQSLSHHHLDQSDDLHPFARSAYGSSLPLEPHQGGGGKQGFFSISSRPTTPMPNDGQNGQNGRPTTPMAANSQNGQNSRPTTPMTTNGQIGPLAKTIGQMDSAAPNVETVGAGNQPSFLSVTRLLLSKHIPGVPF